MSNYMAIDSCSVIYLSKLLSNTDENVKILTELDNKNFNNKRYANMPHGARPQILKDNYLGNVKYINNGKVFANLLSIHYLSRLVRNGEIQLVITPIVLNELNPKQNISLVPFLKKYCKIVSITNDEAIDNHCKKVDELANLYVSNCAMDSSFCAKYNTRIPENDAYIMAEATLLGLNLITANSWDFKDKKKTQDCNRLNGIFYVNEAYDHLFVDQNGNLMTPRPMNEHDLRLLHKDNRLRFAQNSPIDTRPHDFALIDYSQLLQNCIC